MVGSKHTIRWRRTRHASPSSETATTTVTCLHEQNVSHKPQHAETCVNDFQIKQRYLVSEYPTPLTCGTSFVHACRVDSVLSMKTDTMHCSFYSLFTQASMKVSRNKAIEAPSLLPMSESYKKPRFSTLKSSHQTLLPTLTNSVDAIVVHNNSPLPDRNSESHQLSDIHSEYQHHADHH